MLLGDSSVVAEFKGYLVQRIRGQLPECIVPEGIYRVVVERDRVSLKWRARIIGTAGLLVKHMKSRKAAMEAVERNFSTKRQDWQEIAFASHGG